MEKGGIPKSGSVENTFMEVIDDVHNEGKEFTWKSFNDDFLLRCSGNSWPDEEQDEAVAAMLQRPPAGKQKAVKMSLMALLADEGGYSDEEDDYDDEEDEDYGGSEVRCGGNRQGDGEEEGCGVVRENECCVCMVRHKGAAFIPCGHTFCRLCSRELWVSRGNCPLCNGFILEILDIF